MWCWVSVVALVVTSCSQGPSVEASKELADSGAYGYSDAAPIKLGPLSPNSGFVADADYFGLLRGPTGGQVTYRRLGSCCPFETPNAIIHGRAMLDHYEISTEGFDGAISVYVNIYDGEPPRAPKWFTLAGEPRRSR